MAKLSHHGVSVVQEGVSARAGAAVPCCFCIIERCVSSSLHRLKRNAARRMFSRNKLDRPARSNPPYVLAAGHLHSSDHRYGSGTVERFSRSWVCVSTDRRGSCGCCAQLEDLPDLGNA